MTDHLEILKAEFGESVEFSSFRDNRRVHLSAEHSHELLLPVLGSLKQKCGFDMLADLAGIDYLNYPNAGDRFAVVYSLLNTSSGSRIYVKAFVNDPEPELPSVIDLWRAADWMEREVYDLFGIMFIGRDDLRRILLPEEFVGHPLRKDYPLRGYGERHNFPHLVRSEG